MLSPREETAKQARAHAGKDLPGETGWPQAIAQDMHQDGKSQCGAATALSTAMMRPARSEVSPGRKPAGGAEGSRAGARPRRPKG